ncbi:glycoside hydrolase family 3 protein [Paenibacillus tepidiphilus]|uniref:glycoside hydrolase family 3 protein n=1 Tax=Paenibacillus tepidiphilus TaxID=2608683 RepID=UPI00123A338A|nr:glycoside hydrolase family 3 protein [Paenibacillus tepidiphilus]
MPGAERKAAKETAECKARVDAERQAGKGPVWQVNEPDDEEKDWVDTNGQKDNEDSEQKAVGEAAGLKVKETAVIPGKAAEPRLSLEQKVARMCITGLPSREADAAYLERLTQQPVGGIGLFPHNISGEEQLRGLVCGVKDAAGKLGLPSPYYISIDEEGGTLANLKAFFPHVPGNRAVKLTGDPEAAYLQGKLIGSQLQELGIPMNWAPVLDVNTNIRNPVVGVRSYGEEPVCVAAFGSAYIRGLHEAGIAATAKHFPGHGQVDGDSHFELPSCSLTLEELRSGPLLPFAAAIEAGCDAVMMAHIVFPEIPQSEGLPASLSPFFAAQLLRGEMGFEGVICTDDVEMGAIKNSYPPERIGELAVLAGNDLILMCHTPDFQDRVIRGIVEAVRAGRIPEARIDESMRRLTRLHRRMEEYAQQSRPIPRTEWAREAAELTRRTLTLLADPLGLLPLKPQARYTLLLPQPERLTLADNTDSGELSLGRLLSEQGLDITVRMIPNDPGAEVISALAAEIEEDEAVIMGTWNAHIFTGQLVLADVLARKKPLIAAVLRNPYDAGLLPGSATVIAVCNTSTYALKALADMLYRLN